MSEATIRARLSRRRARRARLQARRIALTKTIRDNQVVINELKAKLAALHRRDKQDWMPGAVRHMASSGTSWQVDCPPKGVLHTTESAGDATSVLDAKRAWPHFQVEQNGRITQYYPLSVGARALVHNGPPTNGAHAIQIEVCGYASQPKWPEVQVAAVRRVMRFIEDNAGVERVSNVKFDANGSQRLSAAAWLNLRGWCGHQHVPGNDHWDPGAINIKELL